MDEIYRSQFRMPYALYEQLKASADANHRSVNAELVARLEDSFASDPSPAVASETSERLISADDLHAQLSYIIRDVMDEVLRKADDQAGKPPKAKRPAIPAKGPAPRGKHPKG